jgi:hypothetical protein
METIKKRKRIKRSYEKVLLKHSQESLQQKATKTSE